MTRSLLLLLNLCIASEGWAAPGCVALQDSKGVTIVLNDLSEAFPKALSSVKKGLRLTLMHHVRISGIKPPLAFITGCRMTFDLWRERLVVKELVDGSDREGGARDEGHVITWPDACSRLSSPLGSGVRPGGGDVEVEVDSELNPVSEEQQKTTKSWLAERGIGGTGLVGRFLGVLVNVETQEKHQFHCRLP